MLVTLCLRRIPVFWILSHVFFMELGANEQAIHLMASDHRIPWAPTTPEVSCILSNNYNRVTHFTHCHRIATHNTLHRTRQWPRSGQNGRGPADATKQKFTTGFLSILSSTLTLPFSLINIVMWTAHCCRHIPITRAVSKWRKNCDKSCVNRPMSTFTMFLPGDGNGGVKRKVIRNGMVCM